MIYYSSPFPKMSNSVNSVSYQLVTGYLRQITINKIICQTLLDVFEIQKMFMQCNENS